MVFRRACFYRATKNLNKMKDCHWIKETLKIYGQSNLKILEIDKYCELKSYWILSITKYIFSWISIRKIKLIAKMKFRKCMFPKVNLTAQKRLTIFPVFDLVSDFFQIEENIRKSILHIWRLAKPISWLENCWNVLKSKMRLLINFRSFTNNEWENIDHYFILNLYSSLMKRILTVLSEKATSMK